MHHLMYYPGIFGTKTGAGTDTEKRKKKKKKTSNEHNDADYKTGSVIRCAWTQRIGTQEKRNESSD